MTEIRLKRLARLQEIVSKINNALDNPQIFGIVHSVSAEHIVVGGLSGFAEIGDLIEISTSQSILHAEIDRVESSTVHAALLDGTAGLRTGVPARLLGRFRLMPSPHWVGRIIDASCKPIDAKGEMEQGEKQIDLDGIPIAAMERARTGSRIWTGIRAIDMFLPLCFGQRIGIFAGSGVGKSTLLGLLAANDAFDLVVVALIGERTREVREFVEDVLRERLPRSIVVASTSSDPASLRRRAARVATSIAEYFRDRGMSVCLLFDSVTRLAHAERDISIASGEIPVARGYPPSVLNTLSALLERTGPGHPSGGSITAFYTVLVDGDDHNEPIADHIRGILDGHIVLARNIAEQGRFPAIDVQKSISRLASALWAKNERDKVSMMKEWISLFEESRDLRSIGGYIQGANNQLDRAVATVPILYEFMNQSGKDDLPYDPFESYARRIESRIAEHGAGTRSQ